MANAYTTFPDSVQRFDLKTDVSSSVYNDWKQFNTHIANGQFANATTLLQNNAELKKCIIDSVYMNNVTKTVEEIEDLFLNNIQAYIHETVVHKGEWNAASKYVKYNFVTHTVGDIVQTYECLRDDTPIGVAPTNTTYWVPRVIRGDQGESGFGLTPRGEWNGFTQYYQYDLVSSNNVLWTANYDNIGYFPNDTSPVWTPVLSMNILLGSIKIKNEEIDKIIDGTASLADDDAGVGENDNSSISREEIDNVLNN